MLSLNLSDQVPIVRLMNSNVNEAIRPVLKFLFFFYKKISLVQNSTKQKMCTKNIEVVL